MTRGNIIWFTGNTGAGKTTLMKKVAASSSGWIQLDGDEIREICPTGLTEENRRKNCQRIAKLANLLAEQGHNVLVAVIAPYRDLRVEIKEQYGVEFIYVEGGAANTSITPYEPPEDEVSYRIKRQ